MRVVNLALLGFGFNGQRVASLFQDGLLQDEEVRLQLAVIIEKSVERRALAHRTVPGASIFDDVSDLVAHCQQLNIGLVKFGFPIIDDTTSDLIRDLEEYGVRTVLEKPAWFPFRPESSIRFDMPWVNFPERFNPVLADFISRVHLEDAELICSRINTLYYDNLTSNARKSVIGGCFFDKSIHDVDLVIGLLGPSLALRSVTVERVHIPYSLSGPAGSLLSLQSWDVSATSMDDAAEGYCRVRCIFESSLGRLDVTFESSWIGPDSHFDRSYIPDGTPPYELLGEAEGIAPYPNNTRYNRKAWFVRSADESYFANIQFVGGVRPFVMRESDGFTGYMEWLSPQRVALLDAAKASESKLSESRSRSALTHEFAYEIWKVIRSNILAQSACVTSGRFVGE